MSGTSFKIPIGEIVVDHRLNPRARHTYDLGSDVPGHERASIAEIAESMKSQGQLAPCLVEKMQLMIGPDGFQVGIDRWRLRAGFRRYEAAKLAGLAELEVKEIEASKSDEAALVENVVRANLTSAEYAHHVKRLLGSRYSDKDSRDVARKLGLNPFSVRRYAKIMERVAPRILESWKRTPGAITVPELERLAEMPLVEQEQWFWTRFGQAVVEGPAKELLGRVKKKKRSPRVLEVLRKMILAGHYDRKGHEWKSGTLSAIACYKSGKLPKV